jgi:internalin A
MKKMCISAVSALLLANSLLLPVTTFAETTETIASSSEENVSSVSEEKIPETSSAEEQNSATSSSEIPQSEELTTVETSEEPPNEALAITEAQLMMPQLYAGAVLDKATPISTLFPDPAFAENIRKQLSKSRTSNTVTQAELDKLNKVILENVVVSNVEGVQYLRNLEELSFQDSLNVTDLSPFAKGEFKLLRFLYMRNNKIADLSPLGQAGLISLEGLYVENNQLTTLNGLEGMAALKNLSIQNTTDHPSKITPNNRVTSFDPLRSLRNLETIWAANNQIATLDGLTEANNLLRLYVENNQLKTIAPLANKPRLEELSIMNQTIASLEALSTVPNLRVLYARNNQISSLAPLEKTLNLTVLDVGENQISDISPLKGLTAITGLDVSNQMIILSSVDYIAGKPLQLKNKVVSRDGQLFPPLTISPYGSYDATKGLFEWNLPKAHEGVSYIWESTDKAYLGNFSGTVVQPVKEVFLSETKLSWSKERIEKSMEKTIDIDDFQKTALPFYWQDVDAGNRLQFIVKKEGQEIQKLADETTTNPKPNYVQISDKRGTNAGWALTVKQETQLTATKETLNKVLDGSEIKLSQNKAVSNSKAVTPTAHEVTLVAGDSSNVMSAAEGQGSGTWLSAFGGIEKVEVDGESVDKNTAITLTVPGATPKDAVQYKTVLTWTIADLPSV